MKDDSSLGLPPRMAAALAYSGWWVTGLVFWFLERRDNYVRFHAAQSVAAFGMIAGFVSGFAVLAAASLTFLPNAFALFVWAALFTWLAGVVMWGVVTWKAASGVSWRIPLAADIADRLMRPRASAGESS